MTKAVNARWPIEVTKNSGNLCLMLAANLNYITWQSDEMQAHSVLKALANDRRLQILEWLKNPKAHFEPQVDGNLVTDGVCAVLIAQMLGITQATRIEHMRVLVAAGLVSPKRIKQWIFYRRNEEGIARLKSKIFKKSEQRSRSG